jgi:hypothetical protein
VLFPSLEGTVIVFLYGEYLELEPRGTSGRGMLPPSMYGPPEKIHLDWKDTTKPGLYLAEYGEGKLAYTPGTLANSTTGTARCTTPPSLAIWSIICCREAGSCGPTHTLDRRFAV